MEICWSLLVACEGSSQDAYLVDSWVPPCDHTAHPASPASPPGEIHLTIQLNIIAIATFQLVDHCDKPSAFKKCIHKHQNFVSAIDLQCMHIVASFFDVLSRMHCNANWHKTTCTC